MWFASAFLLFLFSPVLPAQFADLTAPGSGADLYYSISAKTDGCCSVGSIYKVGTAPATLFIGAAPPVFPAPAPPLGEGLYYVSPYYRFSHPQFSTDRTVMAFAEGNDCLGPALGCSEKANLFTTVLTASGSRSSFGGPGWLSRNGRYLLHELISQLPPIDFYIADLQTGSDRYITLDYGPGGGARLGTAGRAVADNGTPVVSSFTAPGGAVTRFPGDYYGYEPVIDASGQLIVYSAKRPGATSASLRLYRPVTREDSLFLEGDGDVDSPSISADGTLVMFLSTAHFGVNGPPGVPQLYSIHVDGSGLKGLTSGIELLGVQQYTMSDDGQTAWYLSGDGRLVKLDLNAGQPSPTIFRIPAVNLPVTLVPGSAVTLFGTGLTDHGDLQVTLDGVAAPLIAATSSKLVFQVPWETHVARPVELAVVTKANATEQNSVQATLVPVAFAPEFVAGVFGGGIPIHQDWSGLVTAGNPASVGEILYFYATGLGPVNASGTTVIPVVCNAPVLYTALAPALVGYYQIAIETPPGNIASATVAYFELDCGPGMQALIQLQSAE